MLAAQVQSSPESQHTTPPVTKNIRNAMASESIILRPTITIRDGSPVALTIQPSVAHYIATVKLWKDNKTPVPLLTKEKIDSVRSIPLDAFPPATLRGSATLICDVLAFPASFVKGEKFSFALNFSQNNAACAVSGSTVAADTFSDSVVADGGQPIHILCKFN